MGKIKIKQASKTKNKGFYIALSVCLIAFLISFFTAIGQFKEEPNPQQEITTPSAPISSGVLDANQTVSNVPAPKAEQTVTNTDQSHSQDYSSTTQKPLYSFPLSGEIAKEFNSKTLQYSKTFGDWRLHLGVDITALAGTPVYACSYGTVEDIYEDRTLGTVVAVDHGEGLMGYYCGLNPVTTVAVQDSIQPGQQLGVLGTVPGECAEPAHLHFAMEKDGVPIDPLTLLQGE